MDKLYLYEIDVGHRAVLGVLLKIDSQGIMAKKIQKHEKVNAVKIDEFRKHFSNGSKQLSPIILGASDKTFDVVLSELNMTTLSFDRSSRDKVRRVSFDTEVYLREKINQLPEFLLMDGHHRLDALQALNLPVYVWIVPSFKLSIASFIKLYQFSSCDRLVTNIMEKFNVQLRTSIDTGYQQKQINFFIQGQYYQINVPNTQSFIEMLNQFDDVLMEENMELVVAVEHRVELFEEYKTTYFNHHIIVMHSPLEWPELESQTQLLPINSTCFKPKPAENSLVLLSAMLSEKSSIALSYRNS